MEVAIEGSGNLSGPRRVNPNLVTAGSELVVPGGCSRDDPGDVASPAISLKPGMSAGLG